MIARNKGGGCRKLTPEPRCSIFRVLPALPVRSLMSAVRSLKDGVAALCVHGRCTVATDAHQGGGRRHEVVRDSDMSDVCGCVKHAKKVVSLITDDEPCQCVWLRELCACIR